MLYTCLPKHNVNACFSKVVLHFSMCAQYFLSMRFTFRTLPHLHSLIGTPIFGAHWSRCSTIAWWEQATFAPIRFLFRYCWYLLAYLASWEIAFFAPPGRVVFWPLARNQSGRSKKNYFLQFFPGEGLGRVASGTV